MSKHVYRNYTTIFSQFGLEYQEDDVWLYYGQVGLYDTNWVIQISVVAREGEELFRSVVPLLAESGVPFQVVKNEILHYRVNFGIFGPQIVGKIITIFPKNDQHAAALIEKLRPRTKNFHGRAIFDAVKLGPTLYATCYNEEKKIFMVPEKIPFAIPKEYKFYLKGRRRFGTWYFLKEEIAFVPKGHVYKGITVKWFAFNWCLIKQGLAYAMDDPDGRSVKERLSWEKQMLTELARHIRVPKVYDLFKDHDDYILVTEFVEGPTFEKVVNDLKAGQKVWKNLPPYAQNAIKEHFVKVLDVVGKMHDAGYVHRDLNPRNMIMEGDRQQVCIIDLELAYSLKASLPEPAFILGSLGYMSHEQARYFTPTVYQDIYALGAMLVYLITGEDPANVKVEDRTGLLNVLKENSNNDTLAEITFRCLEFDPANRPGIKQIRDALQKATSSEPQNKMPAQL